MGSTRLVEGSCDSWNAKFSAQFCNMLTGTFREDDYATRGTDATKASEWLTRQLADARVFADHADGVILVLRAGITNFEQASAARNLFAHDRVRVLGSILNDFNPGREGKGSYYDSYHRYQQATESLDRVPTATWSKCSA